MNDFKSINIQVDKILNINLKISTLMPLTILSKSSQMLLIYITICFQNYHLTINSIHFEKIQLHQHYLRMFLLNFQLKWSYSSREDF